MHEAQQHDANSFITLTIDKEHMPPDGSLDVTHWQKFARRTRKQVGKFRFFHCGEYGDETGRPHYHALLFGIDFARDRTLWKKGKTHDTYRSKTLEKLWTMGHSEIGSVTWQSASYVARYAMKKVNGDQAQQHYERVNTETGEVTQLKPEYATMSRRPGIGHAWIEKYNKEVYRGDFIVVNGQEQKPPKYYDTQQKIRDPQQYERIKKNRAKQGKQNRKTKQQLGISETVQKAKRGQTTRGL